LNPTRAFGISHLDLPAAPPQPFAAALAGAPVGERQEASLASAAMGEERHFTVYTPPGYDARRGAPYPLAIAFDGEWYGGWTEGPIQLPATLDNLVAAKRIRPTLAVLVNNQGKRERDLAMSEPFARFVATELVPWLRSHYRVGRAPADAVLVGSSLGGLTAAWLAFRYPNLFGKVLSQSGAFFVSPGGWTPETVYAQDPGWLMADVASRPRQPVQFWMEVGEFEPWPLLQSNRHMRDVLRAKGYPTSYREFHGGHDYASWRGSIADGLTALIGAP
jgi:enterochelin esterase family protein